MVNGDTGFSRKVLRVLVVSPSVVLVALLGLVPGAHAFGLDGIWHDPTGSDDLYSASPTERFPKDPVAGESVEINLTTWPIAPGQTAWVTWDLNGVPQIPVGAEWVRNDGGNSYWKAKFPEFERGDAIDYYVHGDINGGGQIDQGPFSFSVVSWSQATRVVDYEVLEDALDVHVGDSAEDYQPIIRFTFPESGRFDTEIAPRGKFTTAPRAGREWKVWELSDRLRVSADGVTLDIQKQPYRVTVLDGDGEEIIAQQYDPSSFRNVGWLSDGKDNIVKIEDHYLSPAEERFEGLGERYGTLNHRGTDVSHYVYNQYQNQAQAGRTYYSVPYFHNSGGYGIYVADERRTEFNLATFRPDMYGFTLDTAGSEDKTLRYQFYVGTPEETLSAYVRETGLPEIPPEWAFGIWGSANEWRSQDQVMDWMEKTHRYGIPHSVLVLEQWSDEATFYLWNGAEYAASDGASAISYEDLTFPESSPWHDPKTMIEDLHDNGIKVVLWQIPVLKQDFDQNPAVAPPQHQSDRDYAVEHELVLKAGDGTPYRIPDGQWFGRSMVPDFSNPEATSWWMKKREYLVEDLGVDGFKTDGSEAVFGRETSSYDGKSGGQLHNAYPNQYTGAYRALLNEALQGDAVLFSRAGSAGGQKNSIVWAGDQSSDFESFRQAIRAGQSIGQSGVPYWSWDLAGFTGDFPSSDLYLRASAQAVFSPIMQYHSEKSNPIVSEERTPWNVAERNGDQAVLDQFRVLANLRVNLGPYIYQAAQQSAETGVPMMRSMGFSFPDDNEAAAYDLQYMFGNDLLVAPITEPNTFTQSVYLPEGTWYDFWEGASFEGGRVHKVETPLGSIAVFARAGSHIPVNVGDSGELGDPVEGYDGTSKVNAYLDFQQTK